MLSVVALLSFSKTPQPTCQCGPSWCAIDSAPASSMDLHYVELARPEAPDKPFSLTTATEFPVNVTGLHPRMTYSFAVRSHPSSAPSIAWGPSWTPPSIRTECTTGEATPSLAMPHTAEGSSPTSRRMRVYRVSEYSFSVDFLGNHDAASVDAMPLYLMTCSPDGLCAPWSTAEHTSRWDSCQAALFKLCPGQRGAAFACIDCAERHRDEVEAACGPWSKEDTLDGEGSFSVHWHCGVGWPESTAEQGPITEYCVEYEPLPKADDGYSGYLSCNSDEVDALASNDPRDPSCICICLDDRLLGHQVLALALSLAFAMPQT